MKTTPPSVLAVFALGLTAVCATAQTTSPAGFQTTEGNRFFATFGGDRRLQVVDRTQVGAPWTIQAIAFRRDGTANQGTGWGPRTALMTVRMGHGHLPTTGGDFASNYAGPPSTVYGPHVTNLPDWNPPPATVPAPFDLVMPLDRPFPYDGQRDFVWDIDHTNSSVTSLTRIDRHFMPYASTSSRPIGRGCVVTPYSTFLLSVLLRNGGPALGAPGMNVAVRGFYGPPGAPVVVNVDLAETQHVIPGLCQTLRVLPLSSGAVGVVAGDGTLPEYTAPWPHVRALEGLTLYAQLLALDAGQAGLPLALSNAAVVTMPTASSGSLPTAYVFADPHTQTFVYFGGAPIVELR